MRNQSLILGPIPPPSGRSRGDFLRAINMSRWLLTSLGIWLKKMDNHIAEVVLSSLIFILGYFFIFFQVIPYALHIILVEQSLRRKMRAIAPIVFCMMAVLKYFFMIVRREKIRDCFNHIDIDWRRLGRPADREIMMNDADTGRYIANLFAIFMYSGGFVFRTILPFVVPRRVRPDNTTIRPLIYPVYSGLFDSQKTPVYEIVFTVQWIGGVFTYTMIVTTGTLAAVLTLHACGQLKIVRSRLDDFVGNSLDTGKKLRDKLGEIVELHIRARQLVVDIEGILNEICFVEFIGCTLIICLMGYYAIMELEQGKSSTLAGVTFLFFIISFSFNIFIYCHVGELLNREGKKVGATAYMIEWHKLPGKSASGLILLIAMSNRSNTITAGKMVELSYATFCNVMKTSVAYLNLLTSVTL